MIVKQSILRQYSDLEKREEELKKVYGQLCIKLFLSADGKRENDKRCLVGIDIHNEYL